MPSPYPAGAGVFFFGPLLGALMWGVVACAWTAIIHRYPSGLTIIRGDKALLRQACAGVKTWDDGTLRPKDAVPMGCYSKADDTIYVRNTNEGAKALIHEMAHRDGIADPKKAGYDW